MSEVYDNAMRELTWKLQMLYNISRLQAKVDAETLLKSVPALAIVDRNFSGEHSTTHCEMLKQGFVKEVKE